MSWLNAKLAIQYSLYCHFSSSLTVLSGKFAYLLESSFRLNGQFGRHPGNYLISLSTQTIFTITIYPPISKLSLNTEKFWKLTTGAWAGELGRHPSVLCLALQAYAPGFCLCGQKLLLLVGTTEPSWHGPSGSSFWSVSTSSRDAVFFIFKKLLVYGFYCAPGV